MPFTWAKSKWVGRRSVIVTGTALAVAALTAAVSFAAGGPQLDRLPEENAHAKEVYSFDDVATMTATSHLVVLGTVVSVGPGRIVGEEADGAIQLRSVGIEVLDFLHQRKTTILPRLLTIEEEGWDAQGRGYTVNGVEWSQVGDYGYFFLRKSDGVNTYQLVSSQGRALVVDGVLHASAHHTPLAAVIEATSSSTMQATVQAASADYAAGLITAAVGADGTTA